MTTRNYRTLFVGVLVQDSALSVGGTNDPFTTVDSAFCRDGRGRPTLRGSGLAGALVATLRRLTDNIPPEISGARDGCMPSVWRFFNSHPADDKPEYRQHVAIDARTGAAMEGALFNVETLPRGLEWPFLLEVDTSLHDAADKLARAALAEWESGRCWIGREVARGLGWMKLMGLKSYRLPADCLDLWPNAEKSGEYPKYIDETLAGYEDRIAPAQTSPKPMIEISGKIIAGEYTDHYGLDTLSIGGHASEELAATWDDRFLAPEGMVAARCGAAFDPDFAIATHPSNGRRVPFIPGSSLRGPLRHAAARLLRARNQDPGLIDSLFGTVKEASEGGTIRSGKLLVRDAWPVDEDQLKLAWFQMHAEDEFTAGAYEGSKFDRIAVQQGEFEWKMVVEAPSAEEMKLLDDVLALARQGQIAIGGGQWRGHGWLRWEVDQRDDAHE